MDLNTGRMFFCIGKYPRLQYISDCGDSVLFALTGVEGDDLSGIRT